MPDKAVVRAHRFGDAARRGGQGDVQDPARRVEGLQAAARQRVFAPALPRMVKCE